MRTPVIAGNWKMNTTVAEAEALVRQMLPQLEAIEGVETVVCPPFVSLEAVSRLARGTSVQVGAQNMHHQPKGAYTGEIAPGMLAGLCQWVILGHSERRQHFHEDDELINRKVAAALEAGLRPILAVGERLDQREGGGTEEVITRQVTGGLASIPPSEALVIAYEPVWAIGTGRAASEADASETIGLIRRLVARQYGDAFARQLRVLYGGSVTADNIAGFMAQPEIDGGLVGGASLNAAAFVSIARQAAEARRGQ
ncbi:MAG: triose-phosphate isomerase [Dehalococcoidia bacterium]